VDGEEREALCIAVPSTKASNMQMNLHGGWTLCQQHDLNPTKTWALNQMKPEESMCEWNEHKGVKHVHKTNL
jgi:hypothetical protein